MTPNRRELLLAGAAFILIGAGATLPLLSSPARADDAAPSPPISPTPVPNGDIMLGSDKATVTIIEYASMTCPHCAHFSETTFPELKKRYIDTGKVRFTLRTSRSMRSPPRDSWSRSAPARTNTCRSSRPCSPSRNIGS